MNIRKLAWPMWQPVGPALFFDHHGNGQAFPPIEVRLNLSIVGEERVGIYMEGIGGPFLTPDEADTLAGFLREAATAARLLHKDEMSVFEALAAADALLTVQNLEAFPETNSSPTSEESPCSEG